MLLLEQLVPGDLKGEPVDWSPVLTLVQSGTKTIILQYLWVKTMIFVIAIKIRGVAGQTSFFIVKLGPRKTQCAILYSKMVIITKVSNESELYVAISMKVFRLT